MFKEILVVDDSNQICKILSAILSSQGYNVVSKTCGESALAYLDDHAPDVVLLDVIMPGLDGYQVLTRIREKKDFEKTPVIMLTSKGNPQDLMEGYRHGADYYITKPATKDQVLYALNILDNEESELA